MYEKLYQMSKPHDSLLFYHWKKWLVKWTDQDPTLSYTHISEFVLLQPIPPSLKLEETYSIKVQADLYYFY